MKTTTKKIYEIAPMICLAMICFWAVCSWTLARYVLYDAQNRLLSPEHYEFEIVTAEDYALLSDETQRQAFRPVGDGNRYLRVTTKGTAHHIERTTSDLLPIFLIAAVGLIIMLASQKGRKDVIR
jgi:hypothetical protein